MFRKITMLTLALTAASLTSQTADAQNMFSGRTNQMRSPMKFQQRTFQPSFRSNPSATRRATSSRSPGVLIMNNQFRRPVASPSRYPGTSTRRYNYSTMNKGGYRAHNQTSGSGSGTIVRPRPTPRPGTTTRPAPRPRPSMSPRPRGSGGTAPPSGITPGRIPRYHNK